MYKMVFVSILSAFLLTSCSLSCNYWNREKGSGNIVKQEHSVDPFTEVHAGGTFKIYLKQGDRHAVVVETDDNLQDEIRVKQRNGRIEIDTRNGKQIRPSRKVKVYVESPEYSKLKASGAVDFIGEGRITGSDELHFQSSGASEVKLEVDVPSVVIRTSGAGEVNLSGMTRDLDVKTSGAGKVKCFELKAENVQLDISGAGHADVFASVMLDVKVSGAGKVWYRGNPQTNQKVSGAGSVQKMN